MIGWLKRLLSPAPVDDQGASPARVAHFIERFEGDLREAQTQEQHDNAMGRLTYWRKVKEGTDG